MSKNKKLLDEQTFREIAQKASDKMLEDIPSEEELSKQYTFSDNFEKKMKRLLNQEESKKTIKPMTHRVRWRRVTLIAAIVIVLSACASMSVHAVRSAVFDFFVSVYESFSTVSYQKNNDFDQDVSIPGTIEQSYAPTFLPPGYAKTDEEKLDIRNTVYYSNDEGFEITYTQETIVGKSNWIDTETGEYEILYINGVEAFYANENKISKLVWTDNVYTYSIRGLIGKDHALKMAASLK